MTTPVSGLGRNFDYRFKPHSVTVLQIGPGGEHPDAAGKVISTVTEGHTP
jgi:hypothetical protein